MVLRITSFLLSSEDCRWSIGPPLVGFCSTEGLLKQEHTRVSKLEIVNAFDRILSLAVNCGDVLLYTTIGREFLNIISWILKGLLSGLSLCVDCACGTWTSTAMPYSNARKTILSG